MVADSLLPQLASQRLVSRTWERDTSVFAGAGAGDDVHAAIRNRLGWLEAPAAMRVHVDQVREVADGLRRDGLTDVYLLGMGGSSLCAEVLRDVAPTRTSGSRLVVLDTTDERAIRDVTDSLVVERAAFIVASKSGSTVEVTSLEQHFWSVLADRPDRGRHFIAITDPGTALGKAAASREYRQIFINPPDIGGRYSALSLFGLVPAVVIGWDPGALLDSAAEMVKQCRADETTNPGMALGAFMAQHALDGRDKLTLLMSPVLAPLGPWIEQLVAESTGKNGRGVLPVVAEPLGPPASYGRDRAFVAITVSGDREIPAATSRLTTAGHPVFAIETAPSALGAEFFRWEFATAVAGAVLGVNPFDEPNVRDAKLRTQAQLDARKATGTFRMDPPLQRGPGYSKREHRPTGEQNTDRYFAVLDYLPADDRRRAIVGRLRAALRDRYGIATTHGTGPRYLHSTGQYHKGGPNTGTFLLMTAADTTATPVPGADYTFSTLKLAQALGDFDALVAAGREVVHYHIDDATADFAAELERVVLGLRQPV